MKKLIHGVIGRLYDLRPHDICGKDFKGHERFDRNFSKSELFKYILIHFQHQNFVTSESFEHYILKFYILRF